MGKHANIPPEFIFSPGLRPHPLFFVDLKNEFLHEVNKPKGFQLAYFEETKNNILIVCNGDTENTDKFGRDQKNFILDISTGELQENGIAY